MRIIANMLVQIARKVCAVCMGHVLAAGSQLYFTTIAKEHD